MMTELCRSVLIPICQSNIVSKELMKRNKVVKCHFRKTHCHSPVQRLFLLQNSDLICSSILQERLALIIRSGWLSMSRWNYEEHREHSALISIESVAYRYHRINVWRIWLQHTEIVFSYTLLHVNTWTNRVEIWWHQKLLSLQHISHRSSLLEILCKIKANSQPPMSARSLFFAP